MFTSIDKLIIEFDKALHTLAAAPTSARPLPGATLAEAQLSAAERRHAAALMRVNHNWTRMDTLQGGESAEIKGDVPEVISHVAKVHKQGAGVIGMKLIGEGAFKDADARDASIKFVMQLGTVDAVTIGFKSPAEIDEAIERMNRHLNA